jgi:hypothetical protein
MKKLYEDCKVCGRKGGHMGGVPKEEKYQKPISNEEQFGDELDNIPKNIIDSFPSRIMPPTLTQLKNEMEKEFLWRIKENWFDMTIEESEKILLDFISSHLQKTYEAGRQSIIDEWKEEKDRFLQGFAYKKK